LNHCIKSTAFPGCRGRTTLHVGDIGRDLLSALRGLLHVAEDFLRRGPRSSTAAVMAEETSDSFSIMPEMSLIAPTDSWVADWMPEICWPISPVAFAVCSASAFTSEATTAKPRPASPARGLDGGIQRKQVGLGRNGVDQLAHVANAGRRLRQLADPIGRGAGLADGIARHARRFLDLAADLVDRRRQLFHG
jgi:hypothetical protein